MIDYFDFGSDEQRWIDYDSKVNKQMAEDANDNLSPITLWT